MVRVAINGFGRIGRLALRCGIGNPKIDFAAITFSHGAQNAAHLFKYDSVHGKFGGEIKADGESLVINGKKILLINEREAEKMPWKKLGIDVVLECTGEMRDKKDALAHIRAGAKKVIISAPGKGDDLESYVLGVNDKKQDFGEVVDNASCTTNCLMPVLEVLDKEFGIRRAFMTTVHAYTNDQRVLDGSHKDPRRARAAGLNIIPTTTGAKEAAAKIMPQLKGKIDGMAIRVPVPDGSLVDITAELEKNTDEKEINAAMKKAADTYLKGILEYSEEPLVSSDIIGNKHSSVFDSLSTKVLGGNLVKVLSWYDNEMGYSQRIIDLAIKVGYTLK